jgi:CRP-like cAMP-binding protein
MSNFLNLFRNAEAESHPAGAVVFDVGKPASNMYVVRSGQLAIRVEGVTLETVTTGGLIGEMALVDEGPRSATVVAETDCELVPVDQKRFLFLVQQTPFFAIEVMRTMATRLRAMNQRAAQPRA